MLGWMILFALMAILGAVLAVGKVSPMVCSTFGLLFVVGLLTRLVRGRAW